MPAGARWNRLATTNPLASVDDGSCDFPRATVARTPLRATTTLATIENGTCLSSLCEIVEVSWCWTPNSICEGPGAVAKIGCEDIPDETCDCNGNQLDALGVCGGTCMDDANGNGAF